MLRRESGSILLQIACQDALEIGFVAKFDAAAITTDRESILDKNHLPYLIFWFLTHKPYVRYKRVLKQHAPVKGTCSARGCTSTMPPSGFYSIASNHEGIQVLGSNAEEKSA
jgi:hypothetical protein